MTVPSSGARRGDILPLAGYLVSIPQAPDVPSSEFPGDTKQDM